MGPHLIVSLEAFFQTPGEWILIYSFISFPDSQLWNGFFCGERLLYEGRV